MKELLNDLHKMYLVLMGYSFLLGIGAGLFLSLVWWPIVVSVLKW